MTTSPPRPDARPRRPTGLVALHAAGSLGVVLLLVGSFAGLVIAPREQFMGDVFRIAYIHAPTAFAVLLTGIAAAVCAAGTLATRSPVWDGLLEACLEVAVVLVAMLLLQGAIWSRPTWGSYWSGDPRFFATAWYGLATAVVLTWRAFLEDPARRARWSAAATLVIGIALPVVLKSVDWWPAIHPPRPEAGSLESGIAVPLTLNLAAMALIAAWLVIQRARVSWAAGRKAASPPSG